MAPSRNTASRQNTYRNNSAKHCLTATIHQICHNLSPPMQSSMPSRQQRQGRLLDQMPDVIFPDMFKNIGPAAVRWLQVFYDDVMTTANILKIWRSANVIAIRKPGKPIDEPTSYRPISLLCCCYKLLERLLLTTSTNL